jgi:hypothetical protein
MHHSDNGSADRLNIEDGDRASAAGSGKTERADAARAAALRSN